MRKSIIAALAAVAVIGSTAVYAQHRHHHSRFSAEDRSAFVDARIASVKAGLQLTPDQEKNWPPVEAAVRDFAKQRMARANARASERDAHRAGRDWDSEGEAGEQKPNPMVRLRERADGMATTAMGLKRIADAAEPLYNSLDDGQKRRLAVLTRMGGKHGWRGHGMERGFDPGRHHHGPGRDHDEGGPHRL